MIKRIKVFKYINFVYLSINLPIANFMIFYKILNMFKNSTNNCTNFKYLINCEKVLKCRQGYDGWKGLELIWCWWIYVMNLDEIN